MRNEGYPMREGYMLRPAAQIDSDFPVSVALVGGFLGAGKTTAIGRLARALAERGRRVAVITNDQAAGLVDTSTQAREHVPVAEVAGGCFCCRFDDMLEAIRQLLPGRPEFILSEPVGSCTDLAATVLAPLMRYYPAAFRVLEYAVLVDPLRARQLALGEERAPFGEAVGYLYRKQLEEAEAILLNKCDLLPPGEAERIAGLLAGRFGCPVRQVSSLTGQGMEEWVERLLAQHAAAPHALGEIDYDEYARGEAELGWLNASVALRSTRDFDARVFLRDLITSIRDRCEGGAIAHLKASADADTRYVRAHVAGPHSSVHVEPNVPLPTRDAHIVINARIAMDPGRLQAAVEQCLSAEAERADIGFEVLSVRSFRPDYPRPPYRLAE
jgi:G3E family GTPase